LSLKNPIIVTFILYLHSQHADSVARAVFAEWGLGPRE
jgi:hypothetical protein